MGQDYTLQSGEGAFRVRVEPPLVDAVGSCVLVQSGKQGTFDAANEEGELHELLTRFLVSAGVIVVRLDLPVRLDPTTPADEQHVTARTARVRQLLNEPVIAPYLNRYVMCGFSLGAQSILRLLAERVPVARPRGAVLVGCVIDEPQVVMSDLQAIHLLYGSRDHIAYLTPGDSEIIAIAPEQFAPQSARMLILRPKQRYHIHIAHGRSHLLGELDAEGDAVVSWLGGLTRSILAGTLPPSSDCVTELKPERPHEAGVG